MRLAEQATEWWTGSTCLRLGAWPGLSSETALASFQWKCVAAGPIRRSLSRQGLQQTGLRWLRNRYARDAADRHSCRRRKPRLLRMNVVYMIDSPFSAHSRELSSALLERAESCVRRMTRGESNPA